MGVDAPQLVREMANAPKRNSHDKYDILTEGI